MWNFTRLEIIWLWLKTGRQLMGEHVSTVQNCSTAGFTVQPIHRGVHCRPSTVQLAQKCSRFRDGSTVCTLYNWFALGLPLFLILILSSGNITYTNLPGNFKGLNLTWFCSPDFSVDVIFWDKDEAVDLERLWWSRMWDWSTLISWW